MKNTTTVHESTYRFESCVTGGPGVPTHHAFLGATDPAGPGVLFGADRAAQMRATAERLALGQERYRGEAHDFLCHSDGSTCEDGCDAAGVPEAAALYEAARGPFDALYEDATSITHEQCLTWEARATSLAMGLPEAVASVHDAAAPEPAKRQTKRAMRARVKELSRLLGDVQCAWTERGVAEGEYAQVEAWRAELRQLCEAVSSTVPWLSKDG